MAVINQRKKLGIHEIVCVFGSQIVNNQQIALKQILVRFAVFLYASVIKLYLGKSIKKSGSAEIDNGMPAIN